MAFRDQVPVRRRHPLNPTRLLVALAACGGLGLALSGVQAAPPAADWTGKPVAEETGPTLAKPSARCPEPPPIEVASTGKPGPIAWRDCADTPEMIRLSGGRFLMGAQGDRATLYELPVREVRVKEFALGKYEVSFEEFDACHADGGCLHRPEDEGWGRGKRPVINIKWIDAKQYVAWLSKKTGKQYRLPSEAEWEYAARAGTASRYSWGDGSGFICPYANILDLTGSAANPNWHWKSYCDDGFPFTAPVGSFRPNPWGFHDLNGNVWEWVEDCWHSDYTGAPSTSEPWIKDGQCSKRVNRGGGWGNHPRSMRSASRDADHADSHSNGIGFRVARSLD